MRGAHAAVIFVLVSLVIAAQAACAGESVQNSRDKSMQMKDASSGVHDFDFFVGHWQVHHRRLKERLANSHEWIKFEGTTVAQKLMQGYGNIDDNVLEFPGGTYRAVTLRSFDPKSQQWSIWWLDSRSPQGPLDPPVRGSFKDGVGTFYADDVLNGKPIRVRFIWSEITPTSCQWEQAFSSDNGASWETNWVMEFARTQ
jgi:hypothetical protein